MPDLTEVSAWFLNAFSTLSGSRRVGMSLGGIPLSEMHVYWSEIGSIGPFDEFVSIINAMDAKYLQHVAKTQDEQRKQRND